MKDIVRSTGAGQKRICLREIEGIRTYNDESGVIRFYDTGKPIQLVEHRNVSRIAKTERRSIFIKERAGAERENRPIHLSQYADHRYIIEGPPATLGERVMELPEHVKFRFFAYGTYVIGAVRFKNEPIENLKFRQWDVEYQARHCLLYTSDAADE